MRINALRDTCPDSHIHVPVTTHAHSTPSHLPPARSFGGNVGHDPHVLYTLSAVQILAIARQLGRLDVEKVATYVASLQQVGD